MATYIGRAGKTLALPAPTKWDNQGGQITLEGFIRTSPVTDALRVRDQLLGYNDNWDEPIIPLIVDSEPRLTGYYRVMGVDVATIPATFGGGVIPYVVRLEPIEGFAQPMLESIVSGALLTNAIGAVAGDMQGFHAIPQASSEYLSPFVGSTMYSRLSADGQMALSVLAGATGASGIGRFGIAPTSFYVGAATFEQGSPLQPVVGRTLVQIDPLNWRLSNGLVRVTPISSGQAFGISWFNGTTWSTVKNFHVLPGGSTWNAANSLTVLRNSVEEVVIRLSLSAVGGLPTAFSTVDVSLRRGDRIVRFFGSTNPTATWLVKVVTPEAATAITYGAVTLGGIRATANDGDTNRYVILTYGTAAPVNDLVNGKITQAGNNTTIDVGIGSEIGGSGAVLPHDAVSIAKQYLAAQSESQRVVAR